jgi:hypothetical protein
MERKVLITNDTLTQHTLFHLSVTPSVTHLYTADLYYSTTGTSAQWAPNTSPATPLLDPFHWTSPFTTQLQAHNSSFLQRLTKSDTLPSASHTIAYLPGRLGGLGYQDPAQVAILPMALAFFLRAYRLAFHTPSPPPTHSLLHP